MATPGRGVAPEKTMKNAPLKDREACNDHLLPASLISQNGFTVLQELAPFPLSARRLPGFIGPVPPPTLDKSAAPYSHVIHIRIVWMARRQLFFNGQPDVHLGPDIFPTQWQTQGRF
jgi:hypothetical protein